MSEVPKANPPQGHLWLKSFAGYSHSCGITSFGVLLCWGRNLEGQCDVPEGYVFKELVHASP